tara:strand:+ start:47747 stop:49597 length:1851 start_codon:yes stop_codon:yes gene_type:complete
MSNNKKDSLKSIRRNQRSYLNRDFESFRAQLVDYGRAFFPDKVSDFSPTGFAGMFVEMAAHVGDTMSYYLDHQFKELDLQTAIEPKNVERMIRSAGVKITGASPATVEVDFYFKIAASTSNTNEPDSTLLPVVQIGTIAQSSSGISFSLIDDIDFSERNELGELIATFVVMQSSASGTPQFYSVKRSGICISAVETTEAFNIPNSLKPFRTLTLSSPNVSEIISVRDREGNEYYEVESLTQDTVYKRVINTSADSLDVPENIELIPAPYRFISNASQITKKTTVRFGGGSAKSTDDDIMPDPAELSIPVYGKRTTVTSFAIDPNKLLLTSTLGISPKDTVIKIKYRSGGGISHNVSAGSIRTVGVLVAKFQETTRAGDIATIRGSIEANNINDASGGEVAPTLDELRGIARSFKNSQNRIVTKQDLIARIYTMPSKFGRVYRLGISENEDNPLTSVISILSRDRFGKLIISPDSLKENLRKYLNEYRLISDAIDIVSAKVINIAINYGITSEGTSNIRTVIQAVNKNLRQYFKIENFQIGQPIFITDVINIIINTSGVVSLVDINITNRTLEYNGREYSVNSLAIDANTHRGVIIADSSSIFEIKYPGDDITGYAR